MYLINKQRKVGDVRAALHPSGMLRDRPHTPHSFVY
jgi:hypothetical protein